MPQNPETPIVNEIRLECSNGDVRLFRNLNAVLKLANGQTWRVGLANGSPDTIGFKSVIVTPDMVGKRVAIFVGIEVKRPKKGRFEPGQREFLAMLASFGAISGVARSVDEARALLGLV